ncbi:MAG TPA: hypothetical protein VKV26_14595 [Dehalococcoidia bacterium]|nr:hypothetical protein [Dehalococcoidia bacterium]
MNDYVFDGDVVERQSFLNGTRAYTIAGADEAGAGAWSFSLTLTLPREQGEALREGDLSLELAGATWDADIAGGDFHEVVDETTGAAITTAHCRFVRNPEVENGLPWETAEAELSIGVETAELKLTPR